LAGIVTRTAAPRDAAPIHAPGMKFCCDARFASPPDAP
jgi:hypothetical protein